MSVFDFFKDVILKYRQNEPSCKTVFEHYFFDLKYYLHPTASIQDFSNLLNISPNQLNHISKVNYDCLFETLLNEHRYKHFLNELESPISSNLTIESIFKLSGFEDNGKFKEFLQSKNHSASLLVTHSTIKYKNIPKPHKNSIMKKLYKIAVVLLVLVCFLGCKKEATCDAVQGDWELVN